MINILYLEDQKHIREVTHEYLKTQEYKVSLACTATEAIELLNLKSFDLAILDIMVPEGSGIDVLKIISESYPSTKVIMLTALGDENQQIEAFNYFADDYIIKPFSPIILLKRIEAILRRGNAELITEGLYKSNDAYQVFYNKVSCDLTMTEFIIFDTLSNYPQKVFTRPELLDAIDPDSLMVSDRVIDAHIKNLRRKLPLKLIKTVIGLGYQYQEDGDEIIT
ncbi:response regulator transcription factor [Erysipelothrix urinaevulpis]|uniref:response regulator transcription factor n=1 Tax=Erysipelothrix urinaevulpis TaxID=2683717 RepID=UPI001359A707|nr:response regulator transcription factor [Erysipelothrix urinaevulpis]